MTGNKTYNIFVIGCQMNKNDAERVATHLENIGYKEELDLYKASLVVFVTCGVRYSAENRIYKLIPNLKKKNPNVQIALTGCLSVRDDIRKMFQDEIDFWFPITDLPNFKNIILANNKNRVDLSPISYFEENAKQNSSYSAFVPIGNGCNNFCSYCFVPYARGREIYRPKIDILKEVENLLKTGYKEVTLIAQNVNSYNDGENDFPGLLKSVNDLPYDFWLRFVTSHPKDMSDKLIRTMAECEKFCHHIHIAVQSGDDLILELMNRKYTHKHFVDLIYRIREKLDENINEVNIWQEPTSITTDVIVGFPGESKEAFENTVKLFREISFNMAYVSQFSPRPMTKAAGFTDNIPEEEKKRREAYLMNVLRKELKENSSKYIGNVVDVLIDTEHRKGGFMGHTRSSKKVLVKEKCIIGDIIKVKINSISGFGLSGVVLK